MGQTSRHRTPDAPASSRPSSRHGRSFPISRDHGVTVHSRRDAEYPARGDGLRLVSRRGGHRIGPRMDRIGRQWSALCAQIRQRFRLCLGTSPDGAQASRVGVCHEPKFDSGKSYADFGLYSNRAPVRRSRRSRTSAVMMMTYEAALVVDVMTLMVCGVLLWRYARLSHAHPATIYLLFHVFVVTMRLSGLIGGALTLFTYDPDGSRWPIYIASVTEAEIVRASFVADFVLGLMTAGWILAARETGPEFSPVKAPPRFAPLRPILVWI